MDNDKLTLQVKNLISCKECIFNDGCEKMFSRCPANFIGEYNGNDFEYDYAHLKYCKNEEFNMLTEDEQEQFIHNVIEMNEKYNDK